MPDEDRVCRMTHFVEACLRDPSEVHDQQVDVDRQPEHSEQDDNERQYATDLALSVDVAASPTTSRHFRVTTAGPLVS